MNYSVDMVNRCQEIYISAQKSRAADIKCVWFSLMA